MAQKHGHGEERSEREMLSAILHQLKEIHMTVQETKDLVTTLSNQATAIAVQVRALQDALGSGGVISQGDFDAIGAGLKTVNEQLTAIGVAAQFPPKP